MSRKTGNVSLLFQASKLRKRVTHKLARYDGDTLMCIVCDASVAPERWDKHLSSDEHAAAVDALRARKRAKAEGGEGALAAAAAPAVPEPTAAAPDVPAAAPMPAEVEVDRSGMVDPVAEVTRFGTALVSQVGGASDAAEEEAVEDDAVLAEEAGPREGSTGQLDVARMRRMVEARKRARTEAQLAGEDLDGDDDADLFTVVDWRSKVV